MKSLLRLLSISGLIASSSATVVACTGNPLVPPGGGDDQGEGGPNPGEVPKLPPGEEYTEPEVPDGYEVEASGADEFYRNVNDGVLDMGTIKVLKGQLHDPRVINNSIFLNIYKHRREGITYYAEIHRKFEAWIDKELDPIEFSESMTGTDMEVTFPIYENQFTHIHSETKKVIKMNPGWFTIKFKIEIYGI